MIIIMFDAHKLDISDELKSTIDVLRPHYDKIRVLLNKADTIDAQQLLRVYGALMWQLGKVGGLLRVQLGAAVVSPRRIVIHTSRRGGRFHPTPSLPSHGRRARVCATP